MEQTTTTGALADVDVPVRVKLSALWASVMLCYIYGDYLTLFVPGMMEGVLAGSMPLGSTSQVNLLAIATFVSIPAVMIFLALTLKPAVNRWTNIVLGVVYAVAVLATFFMDPWAYYLYLGIVEVVLTALIVRYAWTWPREEPTRRGTGEGV